MNIVRLRPNAQVRRLLHRYFVSVLVGLSFIVYAFHKPFSGPDDLLAEFAADRVTATPTPFVPASSASDLVQGYAAAASAPETLPTPSSTPAVVYQDGTYVGSEVVGFYGRVQVQAVIQNQRLTAVNFMQVPQDRQTSVHINALAIPKLENEAIAAQSAQVDAVTGATLTSHAFTSSLQSALDQARS